MTAPKSGTLSAGGTKGTSGDTNNSLVPEPEVTMVVMADVCVKNSGLDVACSAEDFD